MINERFMLLSLAFGLAVLATFVILIASAFVHKPVLLEPGGCVLDLVLPLLIVVLVFVWVAHLPY